MLKRHIFWNGIYDPMYQQKLRGIMACISNSDS